MTLVKFGMKSTFIRFKDRYYQYKGAAGASADNEDIGLAIGGYESAFFAKLVASYLLEKTENQFIKTITKEMERQVSTTTKQNKGRQLPAIHNGNLDAANNQQKNRINLTLHLGGR
eukprot:10620593-Ditylum_brightwellii.AAC.1